MAALWWRTPARAALAQTFGAFAWRRLVDGVHVADWQALVAALPDASVDLCLTDSPYGTTSCSWDTVIDLDVWWAAMRRVMKPRGAVVMTASQPYTSVLVCSNLAWFRHELVWNKKSTTDFLNASRRPLKIHENILIFGKKSPNYFPQMKIGRMRFKGGGDKQYEGVGDYTPIKTLNNEYYPKSILNFSNASHAEVYHPTQKPVALFEYLIRTYTHEGALVLDPFVGSGTTALAARNTKRHYICGDLSAEYVATARWRLREPLAPRVLTAAEQDVSDLPLFARGA